MNRLLPAIVLVLGGWMTAGAGDYPYDDQQSKSTYTIKPGDKVGINVPGYSEFNTTSTVSKAGSIIVPLVGEVQVTGLTESQLKVQLRRALSDYIRGEVNIITTIPSASAPEPAAKPAPAPPSRPVTGPSEPAAKPASDTPLSRVDTPPVQSSHPSPDRAAMPSGGSDSYRIQPEDEMQIDVWGYNEFNTRSKVAPEGTIVVPLIGELQAGGWTEEQVRYELRKHLAEYIQGDIQLNTTVTRAQKTALPAGVKEITVLGAVNSGARPRDGYAITRAMPLFEVLSAAGGTLPESDLSKVTVMRPASGTIVVNIDRAIKDGTLYALPVIQPGETVFVPHKSHRIRTAFTVLTATISTATGILLLLRF